MKKNFLGIVVLVVIILVAWYAYSLNHKKKVTVVTPPPVRTASVMISSSGFTPATLSVKTGTKVTWTNVDAKSAHRVKANPYPSGSSLPGLDSMVNMPVNTTYSYTFNTAGTYMYHDQLNPLLSGEVVVTQ